MAVLDQKEMHYNLEELNQNTQDVLLPCPFVIRQINCSWSINYN